MELYAVSDVGYDYAQGDRLVPALKGVSLAVQSGEFLALCGPSGSGKTTLLNLMGLLDAPTCGTIRFAGQDVSRITEHARTLLRREKIGFVFQRFHLIPVLTAYENVEYFLRRQYSAREAKPLVMEALESVGIAAQAQQRPHAMSGGQMQRVAIARALARKPSVVLADEPTAALDHTAGLGILALVCDAADIAKLRCDPTLALPSPSALNADNRISAQTRAGPVALKWVALGSEREWTSAGTARSAKR